MRDRGILGVRIDIHHADLGAVIRLYSSADVVVIYDRNVLSLIDLARS